MRRLLLLLGSALSAQTFVVDAANGPGTHYTTIAAAVAAVPDGSTLLVRPGLYGGFVIDGKGLVLLGGPGVDLTQSFFLFPSVEVRLTSPTQTVVMRGFRFSSWSASALVRDCAGPVLIEDVAIGSTYCACLQNPGTTWTIQGSAQVMLRNCNSWYAALVDSNVVLEGCSFSGYGAICAMGTCTSPYPALTITGGTTQIVGCTLTGGSGDGGGFYPTVPNQPAIAATNGVLRLLAPTTVVAGPNPWIAGVQAIVGTGSLRIDPGVVVTSPVQPAIAASLATQTGPMPAVLGVSAGPGGTLAASAIGPVGNVVVLLIGLSGPPLSVSGFADAFWIDPAVYQFAAFGVPQTGTPLAATVLVPNTVAFLGVRLAWQAVTVGTGGLEASNPTWSLVR